MEVLQLYDVSLCFVLHCFSQVQDTSFTDLSGCNVPSGSVVPNGQLYNDCMCLALIKCLYFAQFCINWNELPLHSCSFSLQPVLKSF